ncbi:hypothetical protein D3C86_1512580 [compost metagenome]
MADHLPTALQGQSGHDGGDQQIGPARPGAEHAQRRQHDHQIAERVVARADPDRAHVGVAVAEAEQHDGGHDIGDQGGQADEAHDLSARRPAAPDAPQGGAGHPTAKGQHGRALHQSRARSPHKRQTHDAQTDAVVGRVAEEVERVRLQRRRARQQTRRALDREHPGVERQRQPQDQSPPPLRGLDHVAQGVAAAVRHGGFMHPAVATGSSQMFEGQAADRRVPSAASVRHRDQNLPIRFTNQPRSS